MLKKPDKVMHISITELAAETEVGESTVIRFCRALGYKGFQEFKLRLAQDLVEPAELIHEDVGFGDSTADLSRKIFQRNLQAVANTAKALDPEMVEIVARAIAAARRVEIYGVGYSSFTATDAKWKLRRLGLNADAYGDSHLQRMSAALLGPEDVAIGVSHSGSTRDVVDVLVAARKAGATTVSITNCSPSPITRAADVILLTASPETPLGGEVLTSRIAQLCVIDALSLAVAVALGDSCLEQVRKTSEAVDKMRY